MRLDEIDTFWFIMGFIAVSLIFFLIFYKTTNDPLLDKLNKFKLSLILGGVFLFGMYLIMPRLGAFDYPYEASDVDSPQEVLKYLQKQNNAIVRLTDITRWTFFLVVFWMISSAYRFLEAFGDHLKHQKAARANENIS
jgi:hypothetical protein